MAKKPKTRSVKLEADLLTITEDDQPTRYILTDIGTDDGRYGFSLEKLDEDGHVAETYHVELYPSSGHHGCDCWGFTRWQHCKHVSALVALENAGRLVCKTAKEKVAS